MIVVQICAALEWASIKKHLRKEKVRYDKYPFGEYIFYDKYGVPYPFYYSGANKTLSSAACQYAIDHWKPEIIFVAGTCGGVAPILKEKDIIIANKTVQYDYTERLGGHTDIINQRPTANQCNANLFI